jgi:hypothetical protein
MPAFRQSCSAAAKEYDDRQEWMPKIMLYLNAASLLGVSPQHAPVKPAPQHLSVGCTHLHKPQ